MAADQQKFVNEPLVLECETHSPLETQQFGAEFARFLQAGDVVALVGELGAGKTNFVKGVARGLGIKAGVHSPTFILANEYRSGRLPLFHIDAYRVASAAEALGFGFDDYLNDDGVTLIEWADRIQAALPPDHLLLAFQYAGENERRITIAAHGRDWQARVPQLATPPLCRPVANAANRAGEKS